MVNEQIESLFMSYIKEHHGIISKIGDFNFDTSNRIGQGGNGLVYSATIDDKCVSIKFLITDSKKKYIRFKSEYFNTNYVKNDLISTVNMIYYDELKLTNELSIPYIVIQRENAKVQKELEEEHQRIEKEQAHYENVLHRLLEQIENEQDDLRREILQEKVSSAKGELSDLEKALKDVDYRQANERAGYVYIISNIGALGENIFKIGMTRRLDPQDRIDEFGSASVPFRFDVHAFIFSADAPKLETALHNAFADKRVNMINNRKEFYQVTLKEIENVVKQNYDKTVDFNYIPDAKEYRESQRINASTCLN